MDWQSTFKSAEWIGVIIPPLEADVLEDSEMARKSEAMIAQSLVDLDSEDSIGLAGAAGKVVSVARRQQAAARKGFEEAPKCPHCGGRMHMNLPTGTINHECMWRQFCLATGRMTNPGDKLPPYGDEDIMPLAEWVATRKRSRKSPFRYGKMESDSGYSTYSAMKQATTRDMKSAAELAKDVEAPKSKKSKAKGKVVESVLPETKTTKKGKAKVAAEAAPVVTGKTKVKKSKAAPVLAEEFDDLVMLDEPEDQAPRTKNKSKKNKPDSKGAAVAKSGKAGKNKKAKAA